MLTQFGSDTAADARALGNKLYRAGKLSEAEQAYKTAASLAPHDSSPISNLSAVRYEMGDYRGAIAHIRNAISLNVSENDDSAKKDKLYGRLVKCFLHLLDLNSAEDAMSSISNSRLRTELYESVESMKALCVEIPDQSVLRRQVFDQLPRYKPCLQDVPEYYCVGHDQVEPLTESFGTTGTERPDISFFFAGSGDGRNVFSGITSMAYKEAEMRRPCFKNLHFTVLDLKPAALARMLIFFNMMVRVDSEISEEVPNAADYFLAMAYIFSCQIIPPFVEAKLQSNIRELIKRLEGEDAALQFIYVREHDREPLIRILRQWQQPWGGISKVADVRRFIQQKNWENGLRTATYFGRCPELGTRTERNDFDRFTTLLLPRVVASRLEPSLVDPLAEYRSTGKSKNLLEHIDSNWRVNNTLIDYDFADRSREQGDEMSRSWVGWFLKCSLVACER
ncbi:hypothetical protein HIM_10082 [Hirsutella minnesotensis 3608]|uniref:DUF4470 domain-containing protein n=1 Tax=Hirsutella minnesotensis 3608 TaxID=1043627 RepID=A0A0F7ZS08_9HYPO|nr:hypothetical protein HIM_10082 [Hirsutella minnesotensis 3608]